eukprot:6468931-Amphidinium_carterae.1
MDVTVVSFWLLALVVDHELFNPVRAAIRPVAKAAAAVVSAKKLQEVKKEVDLQPANGVNAH